MDEAEEDDVAVLVCTCVPIFNGDAGTLPDFTGARFHVEAESVVFGLVMNEVFTGKSSLEQTWHRRLGHCGRNVETLKRLSGALGKKITFDFMCGPCVIVKAKKLSNAFRATSRRKATFFGERIHADFICMPNANCIGNYRYPILFADEYTDWLWVYFARHKSEFFTHFKDLVRSIQAHLGGRKKTEFLEQGLGISRLQTDGEAVLTSKAIGEFCVSMGITHEHQTAHNSEQNGFIENKIGYAWAGSEVMRRAGGLPPQYYPFTMRAFIHTHNLTPKSTPKPGLVPGITPFEAKNGKEIDFMKLIAHLRVVGSLCYAFVHKVERLETR